MKHQTKRRTDTAGEIRIRLTLDVPAEALGLADGYQRVCGNEGKRRKKRKPALEDGFLLTCRNTVPGGDPSAGGCVCEITAGRETAEWERIAPSDYFRYAEAAAAGYLHRIKDRLKVDLSPHINGVQIDTPLTACLRQPENATEALLKNAGKLFPAGQEMRVAEARECGGLVVLSLRKTDCYTAAFFRPGQYILVAPQQGPFVPEPFLLCSSPALTREGIYEAAFPIRRGGTTGGKTRWAAGDTVLVSAPMGEFYHEPLRDRHSVIGVADRDGAAAFLSMAAALRDGLAKFKLTVLYLPREGEEIPFFSEFERICRDCGKFRLISLPAGDAGNALSAASLRAVLPHEAYSVFVCGAPALCASAERAIAELKLPAKSIRVLSLDDIPEKEVAVPQ